MTRHLPEFWEKLEAQARSRAAGPSSWGHTEPDPRGLWVRRHWDSCSCKDHTVSSGRAPYFSTFLKSRIGGRDLTTTAWQRNKRPSLNTRQERGGGKEGVPPADLHLCLVARRCVRVAGTEFHSRCCRGKGIWQVSDVSLRM